MRKRLTTTGALARPVRRSRPVPHARPVTLVALVTLVAVATTGCGGGDTAHAAASGSPASTHGSGTPSSPAPPPPPAPSHRETVEVLPAAGSTVGVGQPVSLVFDHPVTNKAEVERRLTVTTDNGTEGAWGWLTDPSSGHERVDWRPKEYWRPGTKVTLDAALAGVVTEPDRAVAASRRTTFTIGARQVATVDVPAHTLSLERDGRVVKEVPITAGDPAKYPTWSGRMTLMSKEGTIRMRSQSVGLGNAYDLPVQRAMRLTTSGTYAHQAEWAEGYIGSANRSHGCIGLTTADARWFYGQARVGDVFEVKGAGATVEAGNGFGDWNLDWARWRQKSALR
ncbi:Ig-like domain-containing protein [Streptomyces sp. NPDC101733]|uniref:L,D-transpeptidase n=1 Tax=unclassified Streptomyces TaxID=2593676 RepID=UPI00380FD8F8